MRYINSAFEALLRNFQGNGGKRRSRQMRIFAIDSATIESGNNSSTEIYLERPHQGHSVHHSGSQLQNWDSSEAAAAPAGDVSKLTKAGAGALLGGSARLMISSPVSSVTLSALAEHSSKTVATRKIDTALCRWNLILLIYE